MPASKHGLPFVAFTRSEKFTMTAFKNLPPWQDFLEGRKSDMLRMRFKLTEWLEGLHTETLTRHSSLKTRQDEKHAHEQWRLAQDSSAKRQKKAGPLMPCPSCDP